MQLLLIMMMTRDDGDTDVDDWLDEGDDFENN